MLTRLFRHKWISYILLITGVLCIAWSAIFVKLAGISGLGSGFYRMFFGFLGIIPFWLIYRKPVEDKSALRYAVLCGFYFACDIALWNTSIMLSKAAISTLLANLAPVWVGLGALLFLKQKPKPIFWAGTIISLMGVVFIVGIDQILQSDLNQGNILAISASIFYGIYFLTAQKGRNKVDTLTFTTVSMLTSAVVLGLFCLISDTQLSGFSPKTWFALAGVGLISQLSGWMAINYTLGHIKPTQASVTLLSQSVFTALFSIPVLGESLSASEIAGAIVVLIGIYLVNSRK